MPVMPDQRSIIEYSKKIDECLTIEKKVDPIRALMTRQLKLQGTMTKIMKQTKAATELVNCCTLVETTWPS